MGNEREPAIVVAPSGSELTALAAEYYEVVGGDIHKERDCHWQISERWSYGEHVGWFVEHDGYCYDGLEIQYGEDGPHPSREAAVRRMTEHLAAAITDAYKLQGG